MAKQDGFLGVAAEVREEDQTVSCVEVTAFHLAMEGGDAAPCHDGPRHRVGAPVGAAGSRED